MTKDLVRDLLLRSLTIASLPLVLGWVLIVVQQDGKVQDALDKLQAMEKQTRNVGRAKTETASHWFANLPYLAISRLPI